MLTTALGSFRRKESDRAMSMIDPSSVNVADTSGLCISIAVHFRSPDILDILRYQLDSERVKRGRTLDFGGAFLGLHASLTILSKFDILSTAFLGSPATRDEPLVAIGARAEAVVFAGVGGGRDAATHQRGRTVTEGSYRGAAGRGHLDDWSSLFYMHK